MSLDQEAATQGPTLVGGGACGIGSMPGNDPLESSRVVVGETPALPALPELPSRGPGADMIGRTAAMLDGITVDLVPTGWRVSDRPGSPVRRSRSWLAQDLDAFEQAAAALDGPVKVQVVGPWTLAAGIELAGGESLLRDHGARRILVAVLAEAVASHVLDVRRRLPRASVVVVQVDEPSAGRVLSGRVPTASGWATYRSLDRAEMRDGIGAIVRSVHRCGARAVVHACSGEAPLDLFLEAGADGVSFDLALLPPDSLDVLAAAAEAGALLLPGVLAAEPLPLSGVMDTVGRVQRWWSAMGFGGSGSQSGGSSSLSIASTVTVTPTCGLAGTDPATARAVLHRLGEVALALQEDPDGDHVDR